MNRDTVETLLDGLLERELDIGATLTFAGATYPCSGGDQLVTKLLQDGGFRTTAQVSLVLRLAVLPQGVAAPKQHQTLSYTSEPGATPQTLKVDQVDTVFAAAVVLRCHDVNQPA
jgi:hypothetical protein